jgi:hypothetical protein
MDIVDWDLLEQGLRLLESPAIDLEDWRPTDEEWEFLRNGPEDDDDEPVEDDNSGGPSQQVCSEPDDGGIDDLFAELSNLFDGGQPGWMEEELCTRAAPPRRRATEEEKKAYESKCADMEAAAAVQRMQEQRSHRRCQRGECCVYSMWYDPKFAKHRRRSCTHVCKRSVTRTPACGTSLLEGGVFPVVPRKSDRQFKAPNNFGRAAAFASYNRWRYPRVVTEKSAKDVNVVV